MQFLKRLGLFFLDLSLLILSLILTFFVTGGASSLWPALAWPSLFIGFAASLFLFFRLRIRSYRIKMEHEAARFLTARRAAALHPRRTKYFRRTRRCLLWLPSACAFFVVFFFPQATHLVHPGAQRLIHNHVHIPWNWSIIYTFESPTGNFSSVYAISNRDAPWPFGNKPFWAKTARISGASFGSVKAAELLERRHARALWPQRQKAMESSLEFHSHGITLTCRRYLWHEYDDHWTIDCETTSPPQERNFDTHFYGAPEGIPDFYQIIQKVAPAD